MSKQHLYRILFYGVFLIILLISSFLNQVHAADITGDGTSDLIIGIPFEGIVGAVSNAGAVATLQGSKDLGLTSADQLIFQGDVQEISELGDFFGFVLSVGDYNGDGIYDAAVGVPNEAWNDLTNAGMVQIIYGKVGLGLDIDEVDIIKQDNFTSIGYPSESEDYFGRSLATGDFNGDGYDDLAISAPDESLCISSIYLDLAGIVHVI